MKLNTDPYFNNLIPNNDEVIYEIWERSSKNESTEKLRNNHSCISTISADNWINLIQYDEAIKIYNEFDISWSHLLFNLIELVNFIKVNVLNTQINSDFEKEGVIRYLNYKLINAVSGVYVFQNNVIGISEKNYTDDITDNLKKTFSHIYDSYFAYRFCYQYRGYVNHKNLPLVDINTNLSSRELELALNSEKLLNANNMYSWNPKVKKEILKRGEISIFQLIYDLIAGYLLNIEKLKKLIKLPVESYTEIIKKLELNFKPEQILMMRASWKTKKLTTEEKELFNTIIKNENFDIEKIPSLNRFFEKNINLAAYEVMNDRLGYTLAPDHYSEYLKNLQELFELKQA